MKHHNNDDSHNRERLRSNHRRIYRVRGGGHSSSSSTNITHHSNNSKTQSIKTDHCHDKDNRRNITLLIQLLFLTYYGSLGSLLPYLPVYYDHLGHGGVVIGVLGAVKPLTTFLVAPLWGMLADETQQPLKILQVTFLVSLCAQLLTCVRHDAYYLSLMAFLTALFNAPVKSLMDSMVMDHISEDDQSQQQYGRLRLWGQLGFGLGSSGVGMLLSRSAAIAKNKQNHIHDKNHLNHINNNININNNNNKNDNNIHIHIDPNAWIDLKEEEVESPSSLSYSSYFSSWYYGPSYSSRTTQKVAAAASYSYYYADQFWQSITGYKLLFLTHAALSIPTWYCIQAFRRLDRQQQQQQQQEQQNQTMIPFANKEVQVLPKESTTGKSKITEGLLLMLHNGETMFFFFLVLIVGISSGVIENFAYVRMREVGGTGKEMGLSRLVSSMAGAPMFWFSGTLTQALGADRVIVLSLLSYVVRFLMYACMRNPYHGLPAEALRGITFAAFWSTCTIYAHRVSPPGLHATMLMFLNAMYGGLGQSVGAVLGGKLQARYGTIQTFLYAAAFDFVFVSIVIAYLFLGKDNESSHSFRNPTPITTTTTTTVVTKDKTKKKKNTP